MSTLTDARSLDPELDGLIQETRQRTSRLRLGRRDRLAAAAFGGSFATVAAALFVLAPPQAIPWGTALLLVLAYAVLARVEFEVGSGATNPTQLVFVPMLFLLPPAIVPLAVAFGITIAASSRARPSVGMLERLPLLAGNAWYALGPAILFAAAGETRPVWSHWPLYAAALAAQFAFDFAASSTYDRLSHGTRPSARVRFMAWVYLVDVSLVPVGLLAAFVAEEHTFAPLVPLPLAALFAIFASERKTRIDHALELSQAYRGTALLLGDVVEADDAYTGSHSRDVVDLVLGVCDALKVDARTRRDAEFVALLHDVGKIRVPGEIINKPGSLDDAEWAIMKRHTIEGELMLSGVGGLLAEVGSVVRSCHERWDGGGYPDGLAGETIPLIARVVMACDAYSAMTSDRSYRRAMSREAAAAELRANAGTQFDPRVVDALLATS